MGDGGENPHSSADDRSPRAAKDGAGYRAGRDALGAQRRGGQKETDDDGQMHPSPCRTAVVHETPPGGRVRFPFWGVGVGYNNTMTHVESNRPPDQVPDVEPTASVRIPISVIR